MLDLGIDLDVWPWIWLGIAVLFALAELILIGGSFLLLPFAISAFVAAMLAFYDVPVEVQWSVFVFGGAILFALLYQWAKHFTRENAMDPGVGADRLVGLIGIVTTAIEADDTDRKGRVTVSGEVWGALADGDDGIALGSRVRIVSMKGTRVVVAPVANNTEGEG